MNNKVKVLLLGSNGQLGTDIKEVLESYVQLVCYTRENFDCTKDKIDSLPKVDYVINTISYHKTDECEDNPELSFIVNSSFVKKLAEYCNAHDVVLFHISTDYVFDGCKKLPYSEEDTPNPLNVYGISKLAGEIAIRNYHDKYFIFRVSSLFGKAGARGKGGNFVNTMINLANQNIPLKIISNQFMVPTHTLDIAKALKYFILENVDEYGIYHCVSNGSCSWYDFTIEILNQINLSHPVHKINYDDYKTRAKRPKYSVLDNRKLSKYYKMPHWKEALREYLKRKAYID